MSKKLVIIFIVTGTLVSISVLLYWQIVRNRGIVEDDQTEMSETLMSIEKNSQDIQLLESFPQIPGSRITNRWSSETSETVGSSFVMQTTQKKSEVFEYYISELPKRGWEIREENLENTVLNISINDIQGYLVLTDSDEGDTLISVTFAQIKND